MRIVIASGYFDPIHAGHVEYLKLAKELGDKLVVILNNNIQSALKRGKEPFMDENERIEIVKALKFVDEIFLSIDTDKTVCQSIKAVVEKFKYDEIIFAKGGDRFSYEIPEAIVCRDLRIKIVDGLGKKIQSSSELIENSIKNSG